MRIAVTGGTGFLGSLLVEELLRKGHEVLLITRQSPASLEPTPCRILSWPITTEIERDLLLSCEAVINLAGESIASGRWTAERKQKLRDSRIQLTRALVDILSPSQKLKIWISASAVGFYGDRKTEVLTEESPKGEGFLADLCADWEKSALELKIPGLRATLLRTGVVFRRGAGFLEQMEGIYKAWIGGPVGSGDQMLPWIHWQDWVRATMFCLENTKIEGPVNLVSPEPVTNRAFSSVYAKITGQPFEIPTPAVAVRASLGEMADIALDSQNPRPRKLESLGFRFQFPNLETALKDVYEFEDQQHQVYDYFSATQWVPRPLDEVFDFFSNEKNLERLTPDFLNFRVLRKSTPKIQKGTLIDYRLKIHGVPASWRTQIEKWEPNKEFVDTQLSGPYTRWHHTHTFESLAGGTLMKDRVHYKLPLGGLGRTFGLWLVKKDVRGIFAYRKKVIRELFG